MGRPDKPADDGGKWNGDERGNVPPTTVIRGLVPRSHEHWRTAVIMRRPDKPADDGGKWNDDG
jgi:hypothetical protein